MEEQEEEQPPTVTNEPAWDLLVREDEAESSAHPTGGSADPSTKALHSPPLRVGGDASLRPTTYHPIGVPKELPAMGQFAVSEPSGGQKMQRPDEGQTSSWGPAPKHPRMNT